MAPEVDRALGDVARTLLACDDIVICGHASPDGDCLGSQLALQRALEQLGKRVTCLLSKDEPLEQGLRFLPGAERLVPAARFDGAVGCFATVDVPTADRMGDFAPALHASAPVTVTVDHHIPAEGPLSQVNCVDEECPAACMLVWRLIPLLGVEPDAAMATCCYTGLMTDTGSFRYQNTTAEALLAAADMVAHGADPSYCAQQAYQSRSRASLLLEETAIRHARFGNDGRTLTTYLTVDDFERVGAVKYDAEPIIDTLRSVRGISVAAVLRDQGDCVRGSLRAKDDTDVAAIARRIGGGGHKAAAGFTVHGSVDEAISQLQREFDALYG